MESRISVSGLQFKMHLYIVFFYSHKLSFLFLGGFPVFALRLDFFFHAVCVAAVLPFLSSFLGVFKIYLSRIVILRSLDKTIHVGNGVYAGVTLLIRTRTRTPGKFSYGEAPPRGPKRYSFNILIFVETV